MKTFLLLFILLLSPALAYEKDKLEAVYIFNIARFTDWSNHKSNEIKIAVYKNDLIYKNLLKLHGQQLTADGKKAVIIKIKNLENIKEFQILFTNEDIQKIQNVNIITIGDTKDFTNNGGVVWLNFVNKKFKININYANMKKNNINFNSKLLQYSNLIKTDKKDK